MERREAGFVSRDWREGGGGGVATVTVHYEGDVDGDRAEGAEEGNEDFWEEG